MKQKSQPMRICVGCGASKSKRDLLRIVMNSEGQVAIDRSGKAPGRGAYVCPTKECFELAYKARKLEKSFKHAVSQDVYDALKDDLMNE